MSKESSAKGIYEKYIKRLLGFTLSLLALIIFSPFLLIFTVLGTIKMKGNPFFVQERPGRNEKIFKLIKLRTMTNEKDTDGNLLPDDKRLTKYGRFLRSTSIDELPELINVMKGDMSIVGPRPLATVYLPYYTKEEKRRHDIRPGLTGLAQVNGRNAVSWKQRFAYDLLYVDSISFKQDVRIVLKTIHTVLSRENIGQGENRPISFHIERQKEIDENSKEIFADVQATRDRT